MFDRSLVKVAVVTFFAALPTTAVFGADEEGEYGVPVVAVNWSSLHRDGARADVWVTRSFPEPIMLGHDTYLHQSQKVQYAIECADRTYALKRWY